MNALNYDECISHILKVLEENDKNEFDIEDFIFEIENESSDFVLELGNSDSIIEEYESRGHR